MPEGTGRTPSFGDLGGWPVILGRLTAGEILSRGEAYAALEEILDGKATGAQIGGFLVGLRARGETADEMTGLVAAMLDHAEALPVGGDLLDTCGTGGDRSRSINVSTIAAFVAAGAGARVCKHGNRAASSAAGSADVLEALGVVVDLGPAGVARCVEDAGMGFCFAPRFHPAMRHAGPVRAELGIPTVFNFLGPLAHPARARFQVVGVSDPAMAETMAGVLAANESRHAMVVHGADGLDEISTTGPTRVIEIEVVPGATSSSEVTTRTYEVDPSAYGFAPATLGDLRGGDAAFNAVALRRVLDGDSGPHRDIAVLNAAAGLVVSGIASDLAAGIEAAVASIDTGAAATVLGRLVAVSQDARAAEAGQTT